MSRSILTSYSRAGHSADVEMHLVVDGRTLSVGQLGPDFLMVDEPIALEPTDALLVFSIDGEERRRVIRLPEGIAADSPRVRIEQD